jgi:hypothetical protein
MNVTFDMASGKTESHSADNKTATSHEEPSPALALRELSSSVTARPLAEFSIHLVHALLRKG